MTSEAGGEGDLHRIVHDTDARRIRRRIDLSFQVDSRHDRAMAAWRKQSIPVFLRLAHQLMLSHCDQVLTQFGLIASLARSMTAFGEPYIRVTNSCTASPD